MTRQWDSQAGREAIEKLRRDNAIMNEAIETASRQLLTSENWRITFKLLRDASDACAAPIRPTNDCSVLGGEPSVSRETMPTPPLQLRQTDFQIGVEQLDAIKAGVEQPEIHGRTPSVEDLQTLESGD